jgi:N-acetylneuraminate synthase
MKNLEVATLLGASVIEKHFTFDKSLPGNDHYHAMDREDLKIFLNNIESTFKLIGKFEVTSLPSEDIARKNARRSLVAMKNIPCGKSIETDDITWKRPATGISPRFIDEIIGKKAIHDIKEDTVLQFNMFE